MDLYSLICGKCCPPSDREFEDTDFYLPALSDASERDSAVKRGSTRAGMKPDARQALQTLRKDYPYLLITKHYLYPMVTQVETYLREGQSTRAIDIVEQLEMAAEHEEETLKAAFNLFLPPKKDTMTAKEVNTMLKYLGFPSSKTDIDALLKAVDHDGDGQVTQVEFSGYVGRMGGSFALFEVRRQDIGGDEPSRRPSVSELQESITQHKSLDLSGIDRQAQAYWRIVVPPTEFEQVARLEACQRTAVRHIRVLAKSNHEAAMPKLQRRIQTLRFTDDDLWMTLAWIREMAPIIVHINLDKMMPFLEKDTNYRNQFETRSSGGLLNTDVREKWERDLFGGSYDGAKPFDRPKYGVMNVMNDYRGVVKCSQYGDSFLVLKNVRLRCTFSPEDSANLKAEKLAVLDFYGHVLNEFTDSELKETVNCVRDRDVYKLGDSGKVKNMKYKEAQIHGPVDYRVHVERLVAHERHRGGWFGGDKARLEAICEKYGWKFGWRDQEKKRLESEVKHKLSEKEWQEKLNSLTERGPDVEGVPEGRCLKGCGREVAKGLYKGKPFKTCCRGCAMGFGHDITCGADAPAETGDFTNCTNAAAADAPDPETVCVNGCGRKRNPMTKATGRPFTTCCRACRVGKDQHDKWCGNASMQQTNMDAGLCKMGCGRRVGQSKDGKRKFDTCCRGCATYKEHSPNCAQALSGTVIAKQADGHDAVVLKDDQGNQVGKVPNGEMCTVLLERTGSVKVRWKTIEGWAKSNNMQSK